MKGKKITAAVACAALLTAQAGMAAESISGLPTNGLVDDSKTIHIEDPFASPDLSYAFDMEQGTAFEITSLSDVEMDETEGAWWHYALGGLAGGYGGGYGYLAGGGRDPYGFLASVGAGAISGLWSPVRGISSGIAAFGSGFSSGAFGGYGSSRGWW